MMSVGTRLTIRRHATARQTIRTNQWNRYVNHSERFDLWERCREFSTKALAQKGCIDDPDAATNKSHPTNRNLSAATVGTIDISFTAIKHNDFKKDTAQPSLSASSLIRLMELSRPEWKLVAMSAATLAVTSSVTLLFPFASGLVIDSTIHAASLGADSSAAGVPPLVMAGGLFGLTSIAGAGVYLRTLWLAEAGNRIVARLKQSLYQSVLQQESAFVDKQTTGDILSRLSSDASMVEWAVTHHAVDGLKGFVMTLGCASMLLYTSPSLAAVSLCTLPPVFIAASHVGQKLEAQQEKVQKLEGEASTLAEQALSNMSIVKQFIAEDFESIRYHNAVAVSHKRALETAHMQAQLEAGSHVAANAAVLCVLGYGGTLVLAGNITAGDLTGFVMYSLIMAGNLSNLTSIYSDLVRSVAASNRVFEILDRTPQIQSEVPRQIQQTLQPSSLDRNPLDTINFVPDKISMQPATSALKIIEKEVSKPLSIAFESVNFRYPSRTDVDVLKNFNLNIEAGEVVALVGGSGSGKSTVASLLTRLYDINENEGCIRINGRTLRDYNLADLRRMIGVVPQEPALFRGTIRENIAYGEWGRASDAQVMDAARLAFVLDFADDFPDGLETMVGPRGSQLSGGQRQRISIARLLLKNPPLVIFDEATSALDAKSEYFVQRAVDSVVSSDNRTVISIAHRLSTIRHADRIAVIQDGSVAQTGTFNDLSVNDGPFRDLMKSQLVSAGSSEPE